MGVVRTLPSAPAKADRTFRVGIIGSTGKGDYGHGLDVVWKKIPRVAVMAVADDNPSALEAAVKRTEARKGYVDYVQMLAVEKLEIVAVCPRWIDRHREMLLQCAAQGCHVYMEKPFCRTLEEADEVVAAFERKGLKLAIAHGNRYRPELGVVRRMLKEGTLGRILEVRARGKEDRRGGGEDLWVLGTHVLDLMRAVLGEVESCYATVTAQGRPISRADVREGNEGIGLLAGDAVDASYRFQNWVTGYFASHRDQAGNPSRFTLRIFCSKGVIEFPSGGPVRVLNNPSWSSARGAGKWLPLASYANENELSESTDLNASAVLDLLASIEQGRQPVSNIYDARAATEMIVAAFESSRVKAPVRFPLMNRKNPLAMLD